MRLGGAVALILAGSVFVSCGASAEAEVSFVEETRSIPWSDEERINAGHAVCDYLDDYRVEFYEPLGEPYHYAFDDLYRFARNAGATIEQALDLTGSAVTYLCEYRPYEEAFERWVATVDIETLLNE